MSVQNVTSVQHTNFQTKKTQEANKSPEQIKNGDEKLKKALVTLGVIAAAGIGVAVAVKHHNAKGIKKGAEGAAEAVKKAAEEGAGAVKKAAAEGTEAVKKAAGEGAAETVKKAAGEGAEAVKKAAGEGAEGTAEAVKTATKGIKQSKYISEQLQQSQKK